MPHFDYTISLGSILTLIGAVVTALMVIGTFKAKIDLLLDLHAEQLVIMRQEFKEHRAEDDKRFSALSERMFEIVSSVQRLIGQAEMRRTGDRRTP